MRLIDADKLKEEIRLTGHKAIDRFDIVDITVECMRLIDNQPTAKLSKEIRREARMFDTDMIMGCTDNKWLIKVCEAQNKFLYEIADRLEGKNEQIQQRR